jgi:MFS family permease
VRQRQEGERLVSTTTAIASSRRTGQIGFVIAWGFCLPFYFGQYAIRSAPGAMVPELTIAFGLTTLGVSSLLGLYYYTYSGFAIVAGAALDRFGPKYVIPIGIVVTAIGAILFGLGSTGSAEAGRLLQGAGAAFAFTGAVYLGSHGFSAAWFATAVGFTQCFGMLGGSAGQFAVGPMVHGPITREQFWILAGLAVLAIAAAVLVATPSGHDTQPIGRGSWLSMFKPDKVAPTNLQSYLCGFCAGLLFLPTTIGDKIWGVPFLRDTFGVSYKQAVDRATMVPLGWVVGCPLLGYVADRIGRRKPALIGGAPLMLAAFATVVYRPGVAPPYALGLLLGIGSGAAMIPYAIIKEVNPDKAKGSAAGAINFLVFTLSALLAPAYGSLLNDLAGGGKLTVAVLRNADSFGVAGTGLAIALACFPRETGGASRASATVIRTAEAPT